ncbi:MAG: hypothetical protein AB7V32_10135 [Candidatus Berkiella sp.]
MNIGPICVLHLKEVNTQGIEDNPLSKFKQQFIPFSPMTCARHVYIVPMSDAIEWPKLTAYLKEHTTSYEIFRDSEAYAFLLRWATGCESWKLKGNDHFVLGSIRKHWNEYVVEHSLQAKDIEPLMKMLFEDASNIRNKIQEYLKICPDQSFDINAGLLNMCKNCSASREKQQMPDYDNLLADELPYLEQAQQLHFERRLNGLTMSLAKLNLKAGSENLKPSDFKSQLRKDSVGMFRSNLRFSFEKKQLLLSKENNLAKLRKM